MEEKTMLSEEGLEHVVGGTGTPLSGNEAQAFQTAREKFRELYNDAKEKINVGGQYEYMARGYIDAAFGNLEPTCNYALTGVVPVDYALNALDSLIDAGGQLRVNLSDLARARAIVDELKTALGC